MSISLNRAFCTMVAFWHFRHLFGLNRAKCNTLFDFVHFARCDPFAIFRHLSLRFTLFVVGTHTFPNSSKKVDCVYKSPFSVWKGIFTHIYFQEIDIIREYTPRNLGFDYD